MLDRKSYLVGVTPWILIDLRSSKRLLPKNQDHFNSKGVFSESGEAKKAMYMLKD